MPTPDYVLRLRAAIGHELLWLPGVSAIVTDDRGLLLLGRRSDSGEWACLAGILDPGEEPARGMRREILEEAGIEAEPVALVLVDVSGPVHYPNGDVSDYLNLTFWFRHVAGAAHPADEESTQMGWFAADALPAPLADSSRRRIQAWRTFAEAGDGVTLFAR